MMMGVVKRTLPGCENRYREQMSIVLYTQHTKYVHVQYSILVLQRRQRFLMMCSKSQTSTSTHLSQVCSKLQNIFNEPKLFKRAKWHLCKSYTRVSGRGDYAEFIARTLQKFDLPTQTNTPRLPVYPLHSTLPKRQPHKTPPKGTKRKKEPYTHRGEIARSCHPGAGTKSRHGQVT